MSSVGSRWTFGVVELLAIFSALSISLGFAFLIGFCSQLDWRLLQFMTAQDYLSVAAYYVFVVPVFIVGYSRLSYSDHDANTSLFRILPAYLSTDAPPLTAAQVAAHQKFLKVTLYTLALPAIVIVFPIIYVLTGWSPVSIHMFAALLIASSLPYTLLSFVQSIILARKSSDRKFIVLRGIVLIGLVILFGYGTMEGAEIADARNEDISLHLTDGREISGILVYRFSSGIAIKYSGSPAIHFVPESEISEVELFSNIS